MLKFIKVIPSVRSIASSQIFTRGKYFSSTSDSATPSNPPNPSSTQSTIPEVISKKQFITNLYGIEVKKHIFPSYVKKIQVSPE